MRNRKTMTIDVMRVTDGGDERFVATMRYEWCPLFKLDIQALHDFITDRRPSLRGRPFTVYTGDKAAPRLFFNQDIDKIMRYYE